MDKHTTSGSHVPYWVWVAGALALVVPGAIVIAARVVAAFSESPVRGQSALGAVLIGIVSILSLMALGLTISSTLRLTRLRNVGQLTADPVYAGRTVSGFSDAIRSLGGSWPGRFHFYAVSMGKNGFTVWSGVRRPTPELSLSWDLFEGAGTTVVHDYTGRYHALALYPKAASAPVLPLAFINWSISTLSKRRVVAIVATLPLRATQ